MSYIDNPLLFAGMTIVGGTNGYFLYDNNGVLGFQAGGGGGSPGGSDTQVQYNSSGSFAGDANLTYSVSGLFNQPTLYVGTNSSNANLQVNLVAAFSAAGGSGLNGSDLDLTAGNPDGTANGGGIQIQGAASGTGAGPAAGFFGGGGENNSGGGGDVDFSGGSSGVGGSAGRVIFAGGAGSSAVPGGLVRFVGGNAAGGGAGAIQMTGGNDSSSGAGGSITLTPGTSSTGTNGSLILNPGASGAANFSGTITAASLATKTITVVNGIITGFA